MKLIVQLKLRPTPEQSGALLRTLEAANAACNAISEVAWSERTFGKFALQKLCYEQVRERFGLSAQMTIRALAKVGDAYKLDKRTKRTFRPHAAIAYDDRILSFAMPKSEVSIWTLKGHQSIPFVCGERQRRILATRQGESDLLFHRGAWYLLVTRTIAPLRLLIGSLVVALIGALIFWQSTVPTLSIIGLAITGLGVGNLFPLGLAVAVESAAEQAATASTRMTLAGGLAILTAPLTLGSLADSIGLSGAFTIVPILLGVALILAFVMQRR